MMAQTARTMRPQWNDGLDETPVGRGTVPPPSAPSSGALTHLTSHSSQSLTLSRVMMGRSKTCAHQCSIALPTWQTLTLAETVRTCVCVCVFHPGGSSGGRAGALSLLKSKLLGSRRTSVSAGGPRLSSHPLEDSGSSTHSGGSGPSGAHSSSFARPSTAAEDLPAQSTSFFHGGGGAAGVPPEASAPPIAMAACDGCGRTFNPRALGIHRKSCLKVRCGWASESRWRDGHQLVFSTLSSPSIGGHHTFHTVTTKANPV